MKIGWVTPLVVNSAIARVSLIVCDALAARGHVVEVIRAESREFVNEPHLPTEHRVTSSFATSFSEAVDSYDAIFVNIGDNYNFHGGIFEYLRKPVAIGIFHDFYLIDLFNGWRESVGLTPVQSAQLITSVYGLEKTDAALRATSNQITTAEVADAIPMTEWVAMKCAGAVAHANFYLPRLRAACAGVVDVAGLPWPGREVPPAVPTEGKLSILTVGWLNPNKCADVVIEAIGQSKMLRSQAKYVAAGPIQDSVRAKLEGMAREMGVDFELLGSVSDERLVQALSESDVICCLRKPVLEGASASAIEGMLAGRPTMVADVGFYAELPDEYVVKVPKDVSSFPVRKALERLAANPEERRRIGESAQEWARKTFSVAAYVDRIESMAFDQIRLGPYLDLGDRLAARLNWLGVDASNVAVGRLAAAIESMRHPNAQSPHRL